MKHLRWVVVANVGQSVAAKRTDSCGDMEQLELMDLIVVSEHETKTAAEQEAHARSALHDDWAYGVMSRYDYDTRQLRGGRRAA